MLRPQTVMPSKYKTIMLKAAFHAVLSLIFVAVSEGLEQIVETTETSRHIRPLQRQKRQFGEPSSVPQIDLNSTVPYIFSARLYPFGEAQGDSLVELEVQPLALQTTPLILLEKNYDILYIHRDGLVSLLPNLMLEPTQLPIASVPLIAVFWQKSRGGRVFYRETTDTKILELAGSEVNIQYRYGKDFQTKSVVIVTWEELLSEKGNEEKQEKNGNVFQLALILGENACFAHIVYSKLHVTGNPVAGFNGDGENGQHFSLPGSGTLQATQFLEKSNIGIPGEWLFRIDDEKIFLCGAGFQGLECVDSCSSTQWYLDCSRTCHCAEGNQCNTETGECPDGKCNPGWEGSPTCDQDIDECAEENIECPNEQPDCVNTPGAYLCLCFEYDNTTNTCKGSNPSSSSQHIPVPVMPLMPLLIPSSSPKPASPNRRVQPTQSFSTEILLFTTTRQIGRELRVPTTTPAPSIASGNPLDVLHFSSFAPMTIRPVLGTRNQSPTSTSSLAPPRSLAATVVSECQLCHSMAQCVQGKCVCMSGWVGDGQNCQDLDECRSGHGCGLHAECQNTMGSYQCVCNVGFIATPSGCVDVDECTDNPVQCQGSNTNSSLCINTIGGYECRCRAGFTGSPESEHGCVDIDECELSSYYCGEKATCLNTPGSFACSCFEGYQKAAGSSNHHCVDTDECQHTPCHPAARCTNLEGTFHCECIDGFVGNGVDCHETILYPIAKDAISSANNKENIQVQLNTPLTLFGKPYTQAYISPNGIISFDKLNPVKVVGNPWEMRSVNLWPLHLAYNPLTSGPISFQQVSAEGNHLDDSLLARASLTIQNKFHREDFKATSLYIFTFERMRELNLEKSNTFQVAIVQGDNSTFLIYLYESVESSPRGVGGGISHPDGFISIPVELLVSNSNVGQGGKWIFRVDQVGKIFACPAGAMGAPLCQQSCSAGTWGFDCVNQCRCAAGMPCDFRNGFCSNGKCQTGFTGPSCYEDIDECSLNLHSCHRSASCTNSPSGSYTCKCNVKTRGDGFNCEAIDECYSRFNTHCAMNAHCDTTNLNYPECVCNENFHGDGRRECIANEAIENTATTPKKVLVEVSTAAAANHKLSPSKDKNEDSSSEHPFVMPNWANEENKGLNGHFKTITTITKNSTARMPLNKDNNQLNQEVYTSANNEESATEMSGMMMIIVPTALFGVWLVLTIVLVLVCCCRKKRSRRQDKYSPTMMSWNPRDAYTSTRNSCFSQFTHT